MAQYIRRIVNLQPQDYWIVKRFAQERGLGGKGFSAALRMIIREWQAWQEWLEGLPEPALVPPPPSSGARPVKKS